ncbi:MAG: hypothetical protein ACREBU_15640 [Nitrososphaera sp.]
MINEPFIMERPRKCQVLRPDQPHGKRQKASVLIRNPFTVTALPTVSVLEPLSGRAINQNNRRLCLLSDLQIYISGTPSTSCNPESGSSLPVASIPFQPGRKPDFLELETLVAWERMPE